MKAVGLHPDVIVVTSRFWQTTCTLVRSGSEAFCIDSPVLPVLGFILLPWVTLTFVAVAPNGNVSDSDWLWLALAFVLDIATGGFLGVGRRRMALA